MRVVHYLEIFAMPFAVVLSLIGGLLIGYESHPYESCKRMYKTFEDISECVYLKETPQ